MFPTEPAFMPACLRPGRSRLENRLAGKTACPTSWKKFVGVSARKIDPRVAHYIQRSRQHLPNRFGALWTNASIARIHRDRELDRGNLRGWITNAEFGRH